MRSTYWKRLEERRKREARMKKIRQFCEMAFLAASLAFLLFFLGYARLIEGFDVAMTIPPEKLFKTMLAVFAIGTVLLVVITKWVDWDNIRFKLKRRKYRSQLVSPDYYRDFKRLQMGNYMVDGATNSPQGRLDVDHSLKDSDFIALDGGEELDAKAVKTDLEYKDGRLNGIFRSYFGNGKLESEVAYQDGKLDGPYRMFYASGQPHNERFYKDGQLDGTFRAWDEDGALFFEMDYKNNLQHGLDKIYRKNGTLEFEDTYVQGVRVRRKTFDSKGQMRYVQNYDHDEFFND